MNLRFNSSSFVFIISWLLYFCHFHLFCFGEESCSLDDVFSNPCGENSECLQEKDSLGVCHCKPSFKSENGKCVLIVVPSSDDSGDDHPVVSGGSSIALWIIIPCMVLALVGAVVFLIKRLKLVEKLYQFRVRRYNTVFVTSLQDDDAPIT